MPRRIDAWISTSESTAPATAKPRPRACRRRGSTTLVARSTCSESRSPTPDWSAAARSWSVPRRPATAAAVTLGSTKRDSPARRRLPSRPANKRNRCALAPGEVTFVSAVRGLIRETQCLNTTILSTSGATHHTDLREAMTCPIRTIPRALAPQLTLLVAQRQAVDPPQQGFLRRRNRQSQQLRIGNELEGRKAKGPCERNPRS